MSVVVIFLRNKIVGVCTTWDKAEKAAELFHEQFSGTDWREWERKELKGSIEFRDKRGSLRLLMEEWSLDKAIKDENWINL